MYFVHKSLVYEMPIGHSDVRRADRAAAEKIFTRAGITFAWMENVADEQGKDGWFIEDADLKWLLLFHGSAWYDRHFTVRNSAIPGLIELQSKVICAHRQFYHDGFPGDLDHVRSHLVQSLGLRANPVINIGHQASAHPDRLLQPGRFEVLLGCSFSSETAQPNLQMPSGYGFDFRVWGYSTAPHSTQRRDIVENGVTIGYLYGNSVLYIPWCLVPNRAPCGEGDWSRVENQAQACRAFISNVIEKAIELLIVEHDLDVDSLKKFRSFNVKRSISRYESDLANTQSVVQDYSQKLFTNSRKVVELSQKIDAMKSGADGTDKPSLQKEIESIKAVQVAKNVKFDSSGQKLSFETSMLYAFNSLHKTLHEIGEFRITVNFAAVEHGDVLRWRNKTRQATDACMAPHVDRDGKACLGNLTEMLPTVLASQDIVATMCLAIQFIESANMSDQWGRRVDSFPVVNQQSKKIVDKRGPSVYSLMQNYRNILPAATMCSLADPNWEMGSPIPNGIDLKNCIEIRTQKESIESVKKRLGQVEQIVQPASPLTATIASRDDYDITQEYLTTDDDDTDEDEVEYDAPNTDTLADVLELATRPPNTYGRR